MWRRVGMSGAKGSNTVIDTSVYPDLDELPTDLVAPEAKADYVARICGAWDFCIVPERETFQLFCGWRDVSDSFPLLHSAAYAALPLPVWLAGAARGIDPRSGP